MAPRINAENRKKRASGAGHSALGVAKELDIPEGRLRRAINRGEIEVVEFGGVKRIPSRELERLKQLYR
jgi:hypothetical protein